MGLVLVLRLGLILGCKLRLLRVLRLRLVVRWSLRLRLVLSWRLRIKSRLCLCRRRRLGWCAWWRGGVKRNSGTLRRLGRWREDRDGTIEGVDLGCGLWV